MINNFTEDQILVNVVKYIKEAKKKEFHELIDELHPYDIAKIYTMLPQKHQVRFLMFLSIDELADMVEELDNDIQQEVLQKVGIEKSGKIMDLMDNDDLASFFHELEPDKIEEYLSEMKKEESTAVKNLMEYDPETAGRLMTNRYVWIPHNYTVRQVVDKLKSFAEIAETINYLYVINNEKKLVGVVSYRDLILADADDRINDIMFNRVISVTVDTDQEEVAKIIERYDFLAIPVVENERLVGIVTVDDVLDVVIQEANEDIERLSATGKSIDFDTKAWVAAYRRLPWLVLLLFIGIVSGNIISIFDDTLDAVVTLAFFMPMIAGMTGNTGTQSLAVVVRGLVSNDIDKKAVFKLILRELGVGVIIGVICGILITLIAFIWIGNPYLGLVVGGSLLVTLIIGTLAGTIIPLILYRFNIDPAIASGPLITTLNDIMSLFIYFGLATLFLTKLL